MTTPTYRPLLTVAARESDIDTARTTEANAAIAIAAHRPADAPLTLTRVSCDQRPAQTSTWVVTTVLPPDILSETLDGIDAVLGDIAAAFQQHLGWRRSFTTLSWPTTPPARRTASSVAMSYVFPDHAEPEPEYAMTQIAERSRSDQTDVRHSEACRTDRARLAAWEARWPAACRACDAAGVITLRYDPSPAGVSLGSGWMEDSEACRCTSERNVCPRCAKPWPGPLMYQPRYRLATWLLSTAIDAIYAANGGLHRCGWRIRRQAERLWPGIRDGDTPPPCGWCGWNHGADPGDTRPGWECGCQEAEVRSGARCARCGRVFSDAFPAVPVRAWGTGPTDRIHVGCRLPGDTPA